MPKKPPRPRPLSGVGRGKGSGACVFRGPVRPVTNSTCTANDCPDDFWEPYNDEEYDSSSSEQDYFPTDDDSLLWQTDDSAEDSEDFGMIVDFSE